ncbi:transcriptional regulator, IclR family [Haloarcula vallismortis]|uniref:Transcriptional regulator n=2 Tax=Haloarcula vallismortis TaxID=28442 RepID=M0JBM7_HALVA|nr:IclR family transcriptional regulator [Haloarcula vallismortis]EMA05080.1 transcriptional regulator [Haloarcula vallismortis ATCC 29715]SDX13051.1 transcriptional regulator, IclR family [Haloarcula vallismortis]
MPNDTETATLSAPMKTLAIVEVLRDADGPRGVSAVAEQLGYTRSTTYKHLNTLLQSGYVTKSTGDYQLTVQFADIGEHVKSQTSVYQDTKPQIDQISATTGESAGLVIKHEKQIADVYHTAVDDSPRHVNSPCFHCSAPGKAILAATESEEVTTILDHTGLPALTENTITDRETLIAELDNIRDRGIAFERREQYPDVNCVAVPIQDQSTTAAVYVAGHAERLSGKRLQEDVPGMILSAVRQLNAEQI